MPRLSGSTSEFISMWFLITAGPRPFSVDPATGELLLRFAPALPGSFFSDDGTAGFTFLGQVEVTYHNPTRADTWTLTPRAATVTYGDGRETRSDDGAVLRGAAAKDVRDGKVAAITVFF